MDCFNIYLEHRCKVFKCNNAGMRQFSDIPSTKVTVRTSSRCKIVRVVKIPTTEVAVGVLSRCEIVQMVKDQGCM